MQIAAGLGIQPSQVRRWQTLSHCPGVRPTTPAQAVALTSAPPTAGGPSLADLTSENARLRRDLERARAERDISEKAI